MTIRRCLAVSVLFTGLATALAAPAWSDMNGHYKYTETDAAGQVITGDWYVNPCGDGCVTVALTPGGPTREAHIDNGQWVLDGKDNLECTDGTVIPDATTAHFSWDPNTLAGNVVTTDLVPVCGEQPGHQETNTMQLALAP
jgi:hypothetical protein